MERRELISWIALVLILLGLPLTALGYQYGLRPALSPTRVIEIRAAVPEAGGFQPAAIQVKAGEKVTLRFTSMDVTHGIAIGPGLDVDLGHVDAGEVKEITLTFDRPGTYTFYCNTWCSRDHWRMRGVVEVTQPGFLPTPQRDPVIEALATEGVDIDDQVHMAEMAGGDAPAPSIDLGGTPSAQRGAAAISALVIPPELEDARWRQSHPPADALDALAEANPAAPRLMLADAVAYLWLSDTSPERLAQAQTLYEKNCAACHGQTGGGDSPAAAQTANKPAAFSDADYLFLRRSDVLYTKIRRGGMGTDMPNFGTLLTPEETWALVDYLWTLAVAGE